MAKRIKLLGLSCEVAPFQPAKGEERILLYAPFSNKVYNEVKEMEGWKKEGSEGKWQVWSFKMSPRNVFVLDVLSGGEFYGQSKFYSNSLTVNESPRREMWKHQLASFLFKITRRRCIDAGEMGIGKTLSTLEAILYFKSQWPDARAWWIAPNSGLTSLRTQLDKWFPERSSGGGLKLKRFNYHSLEREMAQCPDDELPQILVFDECHALKNPSARRTQLAMQLTAEMEKRYGSECAVIGLTGTPAPENHFDWWSICEVIRPGWLRESSFNKYKWRLADWGSGERIDGGSYPKFLGWKQQEIDLLPKRLEGLVLVTWKKDCMDLPEKVYDVRLLPPSPEALRAAKMLAKTAPRAITAQIRLRELSDGFQYRVKEDGSEETILVPTPKDDALRELQEEYKENFPHRMVVYAAFTASIDRITDILRKEGWNVWQYDGRGQQNFGPFNGESPRQLNETIFQDAKHNIWPLAFVGNPEAAGQGLTLTPSPVIVYYSNSFKSQFRVQSEDRIHRPGADKTLGCRIVDLIHLPTDKLVLDAVKRKRDIETFTLEEIGKALEEVA